MRSKHRRSHQEDDDYRQDRGGARHRPRRSQSSFEQEQPYESPRIPAPNSRSNQAFAVEERTPMPATEIDRHHQETRRSYAPRPARPEPVVTGEPEIVTVKWFNTEKGFGFVIDENQRDLFMHVSAFRSLGITTVVQDQKLRAQRGPGRDGKEAINKVLEVIA